MWLYAAAGAWAQANPSAPQPFIEQQRQQDRERALREQQERAVDVRLPTSPGRAAGRLPESEAPCFRIDRLVLEGERADDFQWLLGEAAGEQIDDGPLGRCLGTQGINTVLERLQQALIAQGWVTSRVLAAPQDLASGTLRLTLVPGRIAAIRFAEGTTDRTSLRTAIPATVGDLLNLRDIEQGLENLKRLPTAEADIQIEPSQAPGAQPGDSDLVVKYSRAQRALGPLRATLSLDDSGTKSTGRTQGGATLAWDGPLGLNDLAYVSANHDLFNHDGQASVTRSGISGVAGDETVRTGTDSTHALAKTWNTDTLVKDVQAQAQITQGFGQQATSAWGKYANGKLADALQSEDKEAAACWSAGGACRVAGHSVIGGLTGDAGGAVGAAASTALVPYLGQMATSAGLSGAAHDAVVTGLASAVGGALGGSGGAAASFNEVNNNYLTSGQWRDFAADIAQCKARSCTTEEQQAIRTSYQELSDQQNIALAKCAQTGNCVTLRDEVTNGTQTMLDLAGAGKLPIGAAPGNDLGQYGGQRLANDPAYRDRVNQSIAVLENCKANPSQCNEQALRAAALVVLPLLGPAGLPLTAESLAIGGAVGAGANIAGQAYARAIDPPLLPCHS